MGIPIHARAKKKPLPADFAEIPHEWVEVVVDEKTTLRGIWTRGGGPPVLLLYGSGMGVAGISEFTRMLHEGGYGVLVCDYRGTGYSSGRWWTSRFLDDDAKALWEWLRANKGEPGGVVGVSIGAIAAAPLLSHEHPPAAVVLDRPVDPRTVIRRFIGMHAGSFLACVSRALLRAKCDVRMQESLEAARTDALVLLPEADSLCPPEDVAHMTAKKAATVTVARVPGGHLSSHLVEPRRWRSEVLDFLDARLRPGRPPAGGRDVPPDVAQVTSFSLDGRDLEVVLDRDDLPSAVTILLMGFKANGLIRFDDPGRRLTYRLPRRHVRRLGRLLAVRAVGPGLRRTTGTRWIFGGPKPEDAPAPDSALQPDWDQKPAGQASAR